jgi:hypothetical protein
VKMSIGSPLLAVALLAVVSCEQSTSPELVNEAALETDVAASAGDAIATALESMAVNEGAASLPFMSNSVSDPAGQAITFNRTRTCYDATGAVVSGCTPLSTVRKIVTLVELDGNREGTHTTEGGKTVTWSGAVHRVSNDTIVRNYNGPTEVSRTHSDVTTGDDTTQFSDGEISKSMSESTIDSIKAVTWNLPRGNNPFPVSGSIKRVAAVKAIISKGTQTVTHEATWTVAVQFPADAQGNVVLTINDKTCNLNLVTHRVSNCQ